MAINGLQQSPSSLLTLSVLRKLLELRLTILALQSVLAHVSFPQVSEEWGQLCPDHRTKCGDGQGLRKEGCQAG